MPENTSKSLAVLIDGDNVSPRFTRSLLTEIAKYGDASVKRVYGDWTKPYLSGWKDELLEHSIQPVQQFAYTSGKNATDGAMIIDAMDLMYTGKFAGFCLVSSDSDFTRLASRLREQGVTVYGFGERKTPRPFITACDKFIYFDLLMPLTSKAAPTPEGSPKTQVKSKIIDKNIISMLRQAVTILSPEAEWVHLGAVGNYIAKQMPDFYARNYGYAKMSELIEACGLMDIKRDTDRQGALYIRLKKA